MSSGEGPTRIAFCITDLDPGGAERALVQIVTRLDPSRWEPHVFCLSGGGALVADLERGRIPVVCFGARSARNVFVVLRLARELRTLRPELIQSFLFHANMAARFAGRLAGVRRIVAGHRVAERRSRVPLWMERTTGWMVHRHVCVSQGVADFMAERAGVPKKKITIISNGVDADRFAAAAPADLSEFGIARGSKTVLFVGRLDPQKGPFLLLEAVRGLVRHHRDLHVLMVGDGPLRQRLEDWVASNNLVGNVHFAGWRIDVPNLLKVGFCLALPSRWEGMPNVVLEAMAAGLPVVATQVEGTAELIQDHETGILVPPESSPDFSGALAMLLSNPHQAAEMGRSAQQFVRKHFTWDEVAKSCSDLYQFLLRN